MPIQPPKDLTPAEVFALLAPLWPTVPTGFRFQADPSVPLAVRAVKATTIERCIMTRSAHELVHLALFTESGDRVFSSPAGVLRMRPWEFRDARLAVWEGLSRCCPTYKFHDIGAWQRAIDEGSKLNHSTCNAMIMSFDRQIVPGIGAQFSPRPDRFWGVPWVELLDGHLLLVDSVHRQLVQAQRVRRALRG